jgi:hypothetical protein
MGVSSRITDAALDTPENTGSMKPTLDLGILAYILQLSAIWQKAAQYAHRRGKTRLPAWSAESDYSQITAELVSFPEQYPPLHGCTRSWCKDKKLIQNLKMESETRMPWKYRFRPSRFAEQGPEQIQSHREYWVSWIMLQLLYHSILTLLNHPLLLSLRM